MIYTGLLAELGTRCTQVELRADTSDHRINGRGENATVLHGTEIQMHSLPTKRSSIQTGSMA